MRPWLVASLLLAAPLVAHAQRVQLDRVLPLPPAAAAARVQLVYAFAQLPTEQADSTRVVAGVPLQQYDIAARYGTRAWIEATLIPVGDHATRVVLTGRLDLPEVMGFTAESYRVTDQRHWLYEKTNRQAWAAIERVDAALASGGPVGAVAR